MVELDEARVGRAALLAVLDSDVGDDVEAEADGAYGGLRGALQLGFVRRHGISTIQHGPLGLAPRPRAEELEPAGPGSPARGGRFG